MIYRLLTADDTSAFCHKVSEAISKGWELYGDPAYAYELAVVIQDGLRRMYHEGENKFYYITTMNENYQHPEMPTGAEEGIIKGLYRMTKTSRPGKKHVNLMGSGVILCQAIRAAEMLKEDFGVTSDIWSATSFTELARDGQDVLRHNRLNPLGEEKVPYVTELMQNVKGPVIAATDYVKNFAEQIRAFVPNRYTVLGTDGFGRSDSRENLRRFFEVDANHIAAAAMVDLHREGAVSDKDLTAALKKYDIDGGKPNPRLS